MKFYKNSKSNTHCVQASLRMLLSGVFPEKKFSLAYLDKVTNHKKKQWTWEGSMLIWLASKGFAVVTVGDFNYQKFAQKGKIYLKKVYGKERFEMENKMANLDKEQQIARRMLKNRNIKTVNKKVTIKDTVGYLDDGYYVLASVNAKALDNQKGFSPHMVIIVSVTPNYVIFHDSNVSLFRKVKHQTFKKSLRDFIAVKFKGNKKL